MPFTAFFLQTYCPRHVHAWEAKHFRKESWRACKRRFNRVEVEASQIPAESVEYKDTPTDIAFIALCRMAYGNIAGWQSKRSWTSGHETFAGMVEVSRALMKGRSSAEQREAVIAGFPAIPPWFRKLFPYSKWGAQLNAKITPAFFTWLVGPMETVEVEVNGQVQQSGVHIKRCRYLAESGCTAMCVNLCKAPTQSFFTEQLGMPLTMNPNFEDYSCEMIFGQVPPLLSEDAVSRQSCLAGCPSGVPMPRGDTGASDPARCHKLD